MKEFLLSDESVNSYGFTVITNGIDMSRFKKNPVMFYNHDRNQGVIGKWTNVRKSENKLFGEPVFDEKDVLGGKIAGKVKDGFIKAASIGIGNAVMGGTEDAPVVLSCELQEVSVCDIPSNENALILYIDNKPIKTKDEILKLCNFKKLNEMKDEDLKQIIEALGLSENATIEDVIKAINTLKGESEPEEAVKEALRMQLVSREEYGNMLTLAKSNPYAFRSYVNGRKEKITQERKEKGSTLLKKAFGDGRLTLSKQTNDFWLRNFVEDFEGTIVALDGLPGKVDLMAWIEKGDKSKTETGSWTLSDYRKYAPNKLKENPELYQRLLKAETENK